MTTPTTIVELRTTRGETIGKRVDYARGTPESPLTPAEIRHKFEDCAAFVLSTEAAGRAVDAVDGLLTSDDLTSRVRALAG